MAASPDYSESAKVPISSVEWNVEFITSVYDPIHNQTVFQYNVSVDPFSPGTLGSPGQDLKYWLLGIEKCANIHFFSAASFTAAGSFLGYNYSLDVQPAQVNGETCVKGINFNVPHSVSTFNLYTVRMNGNITAGPVSYAVVGASGFAIGSTTGPNCECQPNEVEIIIPGELVGKSIGL